MTIRILVADDHPVVLDGLVAILGTQPDFDVVGTANNGLEVVAQASELRPDVLLLDLEMPEMDGVQALETLRANGIASRVIVFTAFDTDERILGAVQAGAEGYLLKGAPREELFEAIRVVNEGGSLLQPIVMTKLLRQISQRDEAKIVEPLSPREREVLQLMARGLQNKEIAAELVIASNSTYPSVQYWVLGQATAPKR